MFSLHIKTGNAAFFDDLTGEPEPGPEIARILRELADRLENGMEEEVILADYNGNRVGRATYDPADV